MPCRAITDRKHAQSLLSASIFCDDEQTGCRGTVSSSAVNSSSLIDDIAMEKKMHRIHRASKSLALTRVDLGLVNVNSAGNEAGTGRLSH